MKVEQRHWRPAKGWSAPAQGPDRANLVLVFGSPGAFRAGSVFEDLGEEYSNAHVVGCTTAGEILGSQVFDDSIVISAIELEGSRCEVAKVSTREISDSRQAGVELAGRLPTGGLVHVLTLSDGLQINGTALTEGFRSTLPEGVAVTGGLSADGDRFVSTLVAADGPPETGAIVAIGLYGERLKVGFGSLGGWDPFGPERLITKSKGNVLYELDGQSALELYEKYLGEHAAGLPATGLLFPLSLRSKNNDQGIVRTILAVDKSEHSLTFAGDVPEGTYARLMRANFDRLIDGAGGAARMCHSSLLEAKADLALLISCVGRKLVLKQRVEEEVERVREVLGGHPALTGFYSYGEICPSAPNAGCELHNQTMTITTLREA